MTQVGSPAWLIAGWVFVGTGAMTCLAILADVVRGYRQRMAIMNWVWPITGLYLGPVAGWFYWRCGRRSSHRWMSEHKVKPEPSSPGQEPGEFVAFAANNWWSVSKGVCHCGAGCTLGDITGEWIVYGTSLTIGGFALQAASSLCAMLVLDFAFAWTYGIAFQYFSIVPMRQDLGRLPGLWAAIKADTMSIIAFQIGLFGFMVLYHLVLWKPPLSVAAPTYWLMMQLGMIVGFLTAWPVNAWLIQRGWKEKM